VSLTAHQSETFISVLPQVPSTTVPFQSIAERDTFDLFRLNGLHALPTGFFRISLWEGEILAASMRVPSLRLAITAFGALLSMHHGQRVQACTWYGRALSALRQDLFEDAQIQDCGIILIACLMFILIECRFRNWQSAKRHYDSACCMMRQLEKASTHGQMQFSRYRTKLSEATLSGLVSALSGLGQQLGSMYPGICPMPEVLTDSNAITPNTIPLPAERMEPQSMRESNCALQRQLGMLMQATTCVWRAYVQDVHCRGLSQSAWSVCPLPWWLNDI
jgi:hypothetical protein